jgi:acyl-CoA hydrolase
VNFTGNISIEVGIKVITEDILTQETRRVNSYFLTMVAMDENPKPVNVPSFIPSNPDQVRRHKAAELRREIRRQFEDKFTQIRKSEAPLN